MSARPPRGRPRSEKARRAILTAAAELMVGEGSPRISIEAVAEQAGVSKATIYRWWPSKELLVLDALLDRLDTGAVPPDTGSLREDLLVLVVPFVHEVRGRGLGRVIATLAAEAGGNERFADVYHTHYMGRRREPMRAVLVRAVARGEISPDLDIEAAIDLVYGPIYHRMLHGHAPLTDEFAATIVELAVAGMRAGVRPVTPA